MSRYWQQLDSLRERTLFERVALILCNNDEDNVVLLYRPPDIEGGRTHLMQKKFMYIKFKILVNIEPPKQG